MWLSIRRRGNIFNFMVEQYSPDLDAVFKALADPTRRDMLQRLASEELRRLMRFNYTCVGRMFAELGRMGALR